MKTEKNAGLKSLISSELLTYLYSLFPMPKEQSITPDQLKVFESVPDLYLILSPELNILTASDAYLAATFKTREDIAGKYVFEAFPDNPELPHTDSVLNLNASLTFVLQNRKQHEMPLQRYDVPRPLASGGGFEKKFWEPVNTPVLNNSGEVLYIIHKVRDVTRRINDQQQIEDLSQREKTALSQVDWEQKKLQFIFMQAPVGIIISRRENHIIELINPRMCEIIGPQAKDVLNRPLFEALPEFKEQGFDTILSEVFSTGKPYEVSELFVTLRRNNKSVQGYFNVSYQPLRTSDGKITGVIHIATEVTEQVEGRKKIEERERQLRLITDSLPVLIGYLDKEEKYRFANKAYEEWFPFKPKDLLGQPVKKVLGEKAYQEVRGYIKRALAGEHLDFESKMLYREDFTKYIRTSYVPDIKNREVRGFYTLVTDITEQTVNRQKVEESEKKYRNLFEKMAQGFCIIDVIFDKRNKAVDYRFIETNNMFGEQTGLKNAKGKTARELIPNLEQHWFEIYGKVALTGESVRFSEGSEAMGRWFEVYAYRPGGNDSRQVALLFTDISERKQAEESLKRSNNWFRLVNQATQDTIWDWDLTTHKIRWNEGVQTMFRYKPEEVLPDETWWYNHVHPEDRERVVSNIHKVINSDQSHWTDEYRFLTGDGGFKIVFDRGFVLHDNNGRAIRMIGSMQDITERKRAEEALKENEFLFRTFANNIQNLAWMADPEGHIYWFNQQWYDYTGTSAEDMQGNGWVKAHHPGHIDRVFSFIKKAWIKGEAWELTFPLKGAHGHYCWFLTRAYPVKDKDGNVLRWIGTNTNIDDQKKAEDSLAENIKQLKRVNNDLDNFIYTASHDLKAPIINIEGLVNLLSKSLGENLKNDQKIQPLMDLIYKSITRFQNTIKDLTEVAKVQSIAEEELSGISFKELLEEVKSNIKTQIDESGATINDDFSKAPQLYFSKKNLRSVLYNLLSNAIKYRSPDHPPVISISTSLPDNTHILLSVKDNGLGIKEKDRDRVFMMFKRLHQHVEGTGIGMAIVKRIVDNNGGRIEIESEPGKGSLFKIYLRRETEVRKPFLK